MWTDNETTNDLLGFRVHADLIRSVVMDKRLLPVTIGVFGDWGGGKTSILKMLQEDLEPSKYSDATEKAKYEKTACLYVNGWLFEGYDDAKSALLTAVLLALGEHKRFGPKVQGKVVSLLKSVNWMRVARLGMKEVAFPAIAAFVTGGASLLPSVASTITKAAGAALGLPVTPADGMEASSDTKEVDWEGLLKEDGSTGSPLDVRSFRDRFAKLLEESDIETLVVLIDDLDRCEPDRIIDNLEAIKLFLNVPQTAFVIGADPRIVRHAISRRYQTQAIDTARDGADAPDQLVTDYLEKLIQVPYGLPRLSPAETETYMTLLFCERDLVPAESARCMTAANEGRGLNRYGVFGLAAVKAAIGEGSLSAELKDSLAFSTTAAPLITEGLKGNPRQVKRFLNAFMLRKKLAAAAHLEHLRDDVLVKLMILEYAQPERFRELFGWQATQDGRPKELLGMEAQWRIGGVVEEGSEVAGVLSVGAWQSEFPKRWIRMDPPLSSEDLRDYFWVARDKLASTMAGVALIPPAIRRWLDDLLSDNASAGRNAAVTAAGAGMDDQEALSAALSTHLRRNPDSTAAFGAVRRLVDAGMPDAVRAVVDAAPSMDVSKIPPSVGPDFRSLIEAHPSTRARLQPVLDEWAGTDTRVGRALKLLTKRSQ